MMEKKQKKLLAESKDGGAGIQQALVRKSSLCFSCMLFHFYVSFLIILSVLQSRQAAEFKQDVRDDLVFMFEDGLGVQGEVNVNVEVRVADYMSFDGMRILTRW